MSIKKLSVLFLLFAIAICVGGCFVSDQGHNRTHMKVFERDIEDAHIFFDKYFWNYDREDPYDN